MYFLYALCGKLSGKGEKSQQIKSETCICKDEKSMHRPQGKSIVYIKMMKKSMAVMRRKNLVAVMVFLLI